MCITLLSITYLIGLFRNGGRNINLDLQELSWSIFFFYVIVCSAHVHYFVVCTFFLRIDLRSYQHQDTYQILSRRFHHISLCLFLTLCFESGLVVLQLVWWMPSLSWLYWAIPVDLLIRYDLALLFMFICMSLCYMRSNISCRHCLSIFFPKCNLSVDESI